MKYILFFFLLIASSLKAQFMSVPYTMHTPGGNVTMNQMIYTPMHYNNGTSNPRYSFEVKLKSDSVIKFKSKIKTESKKMYIVYKSKNGKRKVFPNDTKEIQGISSLYGIVKGFPADSCWLYKVTSGEINCYTSVPVFDINYAMAIQKGNGEIVGLTRKNLEAMTGTDDEQIAKWLKKDKLIKVIEYVNDSRFKKK